MKQSVQYLLIAIFSVICIASCSENEKDDEINSSIVGKWQLTSVSPKEMAEDYDKCEYEGYVEFESNGTYSDHRKCGVSDIGGGKWKLSGSALTITSDILPIPFKATIELSNNTLIISQEAEYWNEDWELVPCVLKETYQKVD